MAYLASIHSIAVALIGNMTVDMGEINAHQQKRVSEQDPDPVILKLRQGPCIDGQVGN